MPVIYFIAYIVGFSVITRQVLAQNPPTWAVWLLVVAFLVGWFVVIGMAVKRDQSGSSWEALKSGPKEGMNLMKNWGACVLAMVLIAGLISLL